MLSRSITSAMLKRNRYIQLSPVVFRMFSALKHLHPLQQSACNFLVIDPRSLKMQDYD